MIHFEAVGKTFRNGGSALTDLTLTAPADQITVFVGPSGSGKTTALRLINRMIEPTSGKISWDGSPVRSRRKTALRRQMGYVSQRGGLFPHRSALENIGTVPGLLGWSKDKAQKRSYELLGRVGLDRNLADRYPAQLTVSQQQRVAIARALAADPKVLLLDDPFAAVDSLARSELHEFLLRLQGQTPKIIVLATDDVDEALKLGDQVAILRPGGRLAQVGTPQHLLDEPADAFVDGYIGRDRGYRSLSFLPARALTLERVKVVRDAEAAVGSEPALMVDSEARPIGWADQEHPGQVFGLGTTFQHDSDSLRIALDSALSSPYSLAVAVAPTTGRFAGVAAAQSILDQVKAARTAAVESISVREAAAQLPTLPAATAAAPESDEPKAQQAGVDTAVAITAIADSVSTREDQAVPEERQTADVEDSTSEDEAPSETKTVDTAQEPASEAPASATAEPAAVNPLDEATVETSVGAMTAVTPVEETTTVTPAEPAEDPVAEPAAETTDASGEEVDGILDDEASYPYDESDYAAEGGHGDSADDAANADDPDNDSELNLDDLDLDLVADRDAVR